MLKDYNKLWVFGDSYSTPDFCVPPQDSFWGLTASHINAKQIINCSAPGVSFDGVMQMLISQQEQYSWKNDLFLIGIPPLERVVMFDTKGKKFYGKIIDPLEWSTNQFDVACYESLKTLKLYGDKLLTIHESRSLTELQTLQKLFLITQWLDSKCARYVIINLSVPFIKNNLWPPAMYLDKYFIQHSKTILSENTYYTVNLHVNKPADYDKFEWMGHHGPAGNKHFFENSLLPTMQRNNFC